MFLDDPIGMGLDFDTIVVEVLNVDVAAVRTVEQRCLWLE